MSKYEAAIEAVARLAKRGIGSLDETILAGLRMTNKDAAKLARTAILGSDKEAKAAALALRAINEGALGMNPIEDLVIAAQPTAAKALESGMASRVAEQGAKNVEAFDKAIADATIGDVDWYGLGSVDADNVGKLIFPKGSPGLQRDVGAGILAKLSPKTQWATNKERAYKAAQAYNSGEMDTFLRFVEDNKLWGKTLKEIRSKAEAAGLPAWKHITGMDTYQIRDMHKMITERSGLAGLKTGELAKKIDDFYGALRIPDADRAVLKKMGLMDPETEIILDPSASYLDQPLGAVPTGTVVDKIQEGLMLGHPQIGYQGFDLPLLKDPRTYRLQSDALRESALRRGKSQLRFQSDTWAKRHYLYPDIGTASDIVAAGGARNATDLASNLESLAKAKKFAELGLFVAKGA